MYENKGKMSLKEMLVIFAWAFLVLGLMLLRGKIIDNAFPEHVIGKSGLISIRHYLFVYIVSSVTCALASIVLFFGGWIAFSDKSGINLKSKISRVAAVIIAVLIGHFSFTGEKPNNFDIHAQKRHDSENGILKSISLFVDVSHDIRKEEALEMYYTNLSVRKEEYKYFWGKSYHKEEEEVIVNNDDIITQIGSCDGPTLEILFMGSGRSLKLELYRESRFIKSIAGMEDLSEFSFTEKDVEIMKKILK